MSRIWRYIIRCCCCRCREHITYAFYEIKIEEHYLFVMMVELHQPQYYAFRHANEAVSDGKGVESSS